LATSIADRDRYDPDRFVTISHHSLYLEYMMSKTLELKLA